MEIVNFETAQKFLTEVLKLRIVNSQRASIEGENYNLNSYAIYDRKELVNFCYSEQELIEHAQYELDVCIKIIREIDNKRNIWFYTNLLNFFRDENLLLII